MALFTLVTRLNDGLPLVASTDTTPVPETVKQQARAIAKKLDVSSTTKQIIDSGNYFLNYAVFEQIVVVLVVTDKSYPKRLTFRYITDVYQAMADELTRLQGGNAWQSSVLTAERPYQFLAVDRSIQKLQKDYADTQSKTNQSRLAEDLADVQNIMRKNISELLDRGEKLGELSNVSSRLVSESKKFKWGAKRLNIMDMWTKAAPIAGVAVLLLAVVYWRFFW